MAAVEGGVGGFLEEVECSTGKKTNILCVGRGFREGYLNGYGFH